MLILAEQETSRETPRMMFEFTRRTVLRATTFLMLTTAAIAQDRPVTLRLASAFDEKTDMMQAAKKLADLMKERTGGTGRHQAFAGGQMGGEKDNLEALKLGELDIGVFGTFPDRDARAQILVLRRALRVPRQGPRLQDLELEARRRRAPGLQTNGIHTLGMMGRGYRHITSNQPINTVDDLKGVKIRMGQSKPFIDAFSSIGAVVVPIALPELFTSLKLGVVSASDGPFDQIYTFKLQEAQKNLAITGHLYATSLWLMNDAAYKKLSAKQRETFDQAVKEAIAYGDELSAKSEEDLLGKLKAAGMQVTKPDYAPFMAKAKPAIDKLFQDSWSVTTADEIAKIQ
jgi:TRAP-type C4-dicarboxylate transport system substrate-binding protein